MPVICWRPHQWHRRRGTVAAASTPAWDRPLQLLMGVALGTLAVRRGRWLVVPAVVLSVRMLLDPGAYSYYTSGLLLATVVLDVGWRRTRLPWVSMGVALGLYAVRNLGPLTPTDEVLGWLRAATTLGVLVISLGPDWRDHPFQKEGRHSRSATRPGIPLKESSDSLIT